MRETEYVIPARFWEDHVDRGCRCSEDCPDQEAHEGYGLQKGKFYVVALTPLDADELRSDAFHYAESGTSVYGPEALGLISSARATLKRMG